MYCKNCGEKVNEKAVICVHCGTELSTRKITKDEGGIGWGALGFFVPLVGLILYLVWKNEKPQSAQACGLGALIGFGLYMQFVILYLVVVFSFLGLLFTL